jgi:16S rRNA (guanine527-N7)-methyltransferase
MGPGVPRGTIRDAAGLGQALAERGVALAADRLAALDGYHRMLGEWNQKMNLVSPALLAGAVWEELYFDSLVPLAESGLVPQGARVADIGSGAGIPGMLLALARPDLRVTLVDSIRKKTLFLLAAAGQLAPQQVKVLNERVEALYGRTPPAQSDLVTFKAFAAAVECVAIGKQLVRPGGRLLLYKGGEVAEELAAARQKFPALTYRIIPYRLPVSGKERNLVVVTIPG